MYSISIYFKGFEQYETATNAVIDIFRRDLNIRLYRSNSNQSAIRVYLTPSDVMKEKFPQTHLLGLSVCDMNTRQVYINQTKMQFSLQISKSSSMSNYNISQYFNITLQ